MQLGKPSQHMFSVLQDEVVNELHQQFFKEFILTSQGQFALAELNTTTT